MCRLAAITGALLCWPPLAVLALRRNDRLASDPDPFAKASLLFLDEYANAGPGGADVESAWRLYTAPWMRCHRLARKVSAAPRPRQGTSRAR
ncbi:hypothetical protein GCM10008020_25850 [Massilia psychrophila]|nr:hypothetical protein GCM10008020_25850 [Massilia psychrophila]